MPDINHGIGGQLPQRVRDTARIRSLRNPDCKEEASHPEVDKKTDKMAAEGRDKREDNLPAWNFATKTLR